MQRCIIVVFGVATQHGDVRLHGMMGFDRATIFGAMNRHQLRK